MSDRAGLDSESFTRLNRSKRQRHLARGFLLPTGMRPASSGLGSRPPASTDLSPRQLRVLATLRQSERGIAAARLAEMLDLSTGEVRRALADLRELRLASAERERGTSRNVWSATP